MTFGLYFIYTTVISLQILVLYIGVSKLLFVIISRVCNQVEDILSTNVLFNSLIWVEEFPFHLLCNLLILMICL